MGMNLDIASLYSVKGLGILDNDGKRVIFKYYDNERFGTQKQQRQFETNLFAKTHKANGEIILLDGLVSVYRSNVDVFFYVIGSASENELILLQLLNCFYDAMSTILRKNVEKTSIFQHLDTTFLVIDELVDEGIILETDSNAIVQRCALRPDDLAFGDQSLGQLGQSLIGSAQTMKWSFLKMVLLTLLCRIRDGLILATSIEGGDDPNNAQVKYTSQAKLLFRKLNAPNTPQQQSVESGPYFFHYTIKQGVCALCLCERSFPRNAAFAFLEDVVGEFLSQNGSRVEQVQRPYHFIEFDTYIKQAKSRYADKNRFAMSAVTNELQDVQRIMVSNIEEIINRGEAINVLEDQSMGLRDISKKYRENANRLNQKSTLFLIFCAVGTAGALFFFYKFYLLLF
uniref:V-SNARE coiled-coil homology domain-containing protein n=1 Tax=Rhabditophanes sp. KR3021 TaxID=114890 RepID=A0AC35TG56_9BILA